MLLYNLLLHIARSLRSRRRRRLRRLRRPSRPSRLARSSDGRGVRRVLRLVGDFGGRLDGHRDLHGLLHHVHVHHDVLLVQLQLLAALLALDGALLTREDRELHDQADHHCHRHTDEQDVVPGQRDVQRLARVENEEEIDTDRETDDRRVHLEPATKRLARAEDVLANQPKNKGGEKTGDDRGDDPGKSDLSHLAPVHSLPSLRNHCHSDKSSDAGVRC